MLTLPDHGNDLGAADFGLNTYSNKDVPPSTVFGPLLVWQPRVTMSELFVGELLV